MSKAKTLATTVSTGGVLADGSVAASEVSGLATVATTGAYTDISGRPTLATVATSGAYTDLSGRPTLPSGTIVGTSDSQTLTNKTLTDPAIVGTILEDVYTIVDAAAFEIDPANGSVQLVTLGANRTPKATNFLAGECVTLMIDDGSAFTVTWTDATFGGSGVVWKTDGGNAPTLNTTGYTVVVLWKVSTQVYGARVGNA